MTLAFISAEQIWEINVWSLSDLTIGDSLRARNSPAGLQSYASNLRWKPKPPMPNRFELEFEFEVKNARMKDEMFGYTAYILQQPPPPYLDAASS